MADITKEVDLTNDWKELTSSQSLAVGSTYAIDAVDLSSGTIFSAKTDDANVPPVAKGHPWWPVGDAIEQREITIKSGEYIWARVENDTCKLEITVV